MLVTNDDPKFPVGLAVTEWRANRELRYFMLLPYRVGNEVLVEVEVSFADPIVVVSPALPEWAPIKNGHGDRVFGYPVSDETMNDVYMVWDNGAKSDTDTSRRVYLAYKSILEHYSAAANDYLHKISRDNYERRINEARNSGWDISLIVKEELTFPYFST